MQVTGYHRKYASWILSNWGKEVHSCIEGKAVRVVVGKPKRKKGSGRPRTYDDELLKALKKLWGLFDYLCGKRLAVVLRAVLPVLEKHRELVLAEEVKQKLTQISPATIDRLLQAEKNRLRFKSRSHTKPGTLLKHQIPIRTFSQWDERKPGYVELDLVGHDGGNPCGQYAFTLTATDIHTGCTETRAVRNRAQKWVLAALLDVQNHLPFPLLGIDADNGGEFINHNLMSYCQKQGISFTRSRPYHKNDGCFVEQKNNALVRNAVGYLRYICAANQVNQIHLPEGWVFALTAMRVNTRGTWRTVILAVRLHIREKTEA